MVNATTPPLMLQLCLRSLALLSILSLATVHADQSVPEKPLVDFTSPAAEQAGRVTSDQMKITRATGKTAGLDVVTVSGSSQYPTVVFEPKDAPVWDASAYGHVETRITNTGTHAMWVQMRVDNAGEGRLNPWNLNGIQLKPGATGTLRVTFGYTYAQPKYALDPSKIVKINLMLPKVDFNRQFRIESLSMGGSPGEKPASENKTAPVSR